MRSKLVAAVVVLASFAGCDAFVEDPAAPTDDDDAGLADAAPEAATSDAATTEVPPTPDAGADASPPLATGCARFAGATFCDDFETGMPKAEWQAGGYGTGVTTGIGAPGFSGSASLVAAVPAGLQNAGAYYSQNRGITSSIRLHGDVRIPKYGTDPSDYVGVLALRVDATPQISVRAISRPQSRVLELSIVDNGSGANLGSGTLTDITLAAFTAVELEVALGPDIAFTLRGAGKATTAKVKAQVLPDTTNVTVFAGIPLSSSVGAATEVLVDDVAIWAQ